MSDETKVPYQFLGQKLRLLRESNNESIAEVSGAVEIAEKDLLAFESGYTRPTEDILLLLFSHFDIEGFKAEELWKLAGYDGLPDGTDNMPPTSQPMHQHQPTMMVMIDPRIIYSDGIEAVAGDRGVVLNFSQTNGPGGQPLAISRIGMSREQAKQLMGVLHQVLYDFDNQPNNKQLGQGDSPKPDSQ